LTAFEAKENRFDVLVSTDLRLHDLILSAAKSLIWRAISVKLAGADAQGVDALHEPVEGEL
jgi:hypothetical protein